MGLFGQDHKPDPKEQVRQWQRKLRQETRTLDRQVAAITREEMKVKRQIKESAKKGDMEVCKILAKEIVNSRKAVGKIYMSKAQINSVSMGMQNQLAALRMAGSLQKSTEVMQSMQSLVRLPEVAATMRELSKEMMKAGIIEEMMEDTLESIEPEELEEEAQEEVDKVLNEVLKGKLVEAPAVPESSINVGPEEEEEEEEEAIGAVGGNMTEMQQRLEALRSD